MSDVFLSYAREDEGLARLLAEHLETSGLSVWWDRVIPVGTTWDDLIGRQIAAARCVIVIWSASSIASKWVRAEAHSADGRGVLIPVTIESVPPPFPFNLVQAVDLTGWDGDPDDPRLEQMVAAARRLASQSATASDTAPPARSRRSPVRRLRWRMAASAVLLVVLAAAGVGVWLKTRAAQAPKIPERPANSEPERTNPPLVTKPTPAPATDVQPAPPQPRATATARRRKPPAQPVIESRNVPGDARRDTAPDAGAPTRESAGATTPAAKPEPSAPSEEPPPPARPPVPTHDELIKAALSSYESAREDRNVEALRQVWPKVPEAEFRKAWRSVTAERVRLTDCSRTILNGSAATVTCREHVESQLFGGGVGRVLTLTTFTLDRSDAGWTIGNITRKLIH